MMDSYELQHAREVGARIVKLLDECHMTQAELARNLGISRSMVNKYCKGLSAPSAALIVRISEVLGVSTDVLLGRDSLEETQQDASAARTIIETRIEKLNPAELDAVAAIVKTLVDK